MSAESPILPEQSSISGLQALRAFKDTGLGLDVDPVVFHRSHKVRPLVRGQMQEVSTSIASLVDSDPVFIWSEVDEDGFHAATARDQDVKKALATIDYLVEEASAMSDSRTDEERQMGAYALTEKAQEVAILAAPYIPKSVKESIDLEEYERAASNNNPENDTSVDNSDPFQFKLPQLNLRMPFSFRIPGINLGSRSRRGVSRGPNLDGLKKLAGKLGLNLNASFENPLLSSKYTAGEKRQRMFNFNSDVVMKTNNEMISYNGKGEIFVLTNIYNSYNSETGELNINAPRVPYSLSRSGSGVITTPLGVIDMERTKEVGVPIPVHKQNEHRNSTLWSNNRHQLSSVVFSTEKGLPLLNTKEIQPYLITDDLGNVFVDISNMPSELVSKIQGKKVVMEASYGDYFIPDYEIEPAEWIGPMSEQEKFRLNLYPKEIAAFVTTLKEKQRKKVIGFTTNREIFSHLAQFIGNFWLTYSLLDAPFRNDDPVGFNQTERVLAGNYASCEGANIALGQLMRYFLNENEGIAYATGFVVTNKMARGLNYHLKVLYKDDMGFTHFFDATPWNEETQMEFNVASLKRRNAAKEWYQKTKELRQSPTRETAESLRTRSREIDERLVSFWQAGFKSDDFKQELDKRHMRMQFLPGIVSEGHEAESFIVRYLEEPITKRKWLFFTERSQKYLNLINLINFLKNHNEADEEFGSFWKNSANPIDGTLRFNLKFLVRSLYVGSLPVSLDNYLEITPERMRFLNDSVLRSEQIDIMATVAKQAVAASSQNIEAFNIFLDKMDQISSEYEEKFKAVFASVSDRLESDVDSFWQKAPFLLLLHNPISHLRRIFERSVEPEKIGFLIPSRKKEIEAEIEEKLQHWKKAADALLAEYMERIKKAPESTATREVTPVSSTLLWQNLDGGQKNKIRRKEKKFLDPIETFFFLYTH